MALVEARPKDIPWFGKRDCKAWRRIIAGKVYLTDIELADGPSGRDRRRGARGNYQRRTRTT